MNKKEFFLTNAIKYSKKNQDNIINIDVFNEDEYLNFQISDSGIGIKDNDLEKINKFNLDIDALP